MCRQQLRTLWRQQLRTAPSKRHDWKVFHGLRKFKTYANRKMQTTNVESLMDHKTDVDSFYDRPPIGIVLQDSLKAVPDLTIFTSNQAITEQT